MHAILPSHTLKPRQCFNTCFAWHFIRNTQYPIGALELVVHLWRFDGDNLRVKMTVLNCCPSTHLRLQSKAVGIAPS